LNNYNNNKIVITIFIIFYIFSFEIDIILKDYLKIIYFLIIH